MDAGMFGSDVLAAFPHQIICNHSIWWRI